MVYAMMDEKKLNHNDEVVTKWERLEEKIIGIYADTTRSDRLIGVMLSTDMVQNKLTDQGQSSSLRNPIKFIPNRNRSQDIPQELIDLTAQALSIEESISRITGMDMHQQYP